MQNLNINMNVFFSIANDSVYNTSNAYSEEIFIIWNTQFTTNSQICFLSNKSNINQYAWLAIGK